MAFRLCPCFFLRRLFSLRSRPIEPYQRKKTYPSFFPPQLKMEAFYILLFAAIAVTTVLFELGKGRAGGGSLSSSSTSSLTRDFVAFRNNYVLVYALMMGKPLLLFSSN